jgi:phosphohistidine phosphatase SixA
MDLILWRHAEAQEGAPDHERELTAKGNRQAEKVAEFAQRAAYSGQSRDSHPANHSRPD